MPPLEDDLKEMGLSDAELEALEGDDNVYADLKALAEGADDLDGGDDDPGTGEGDGKDIATSQADAGPGTETRQEQQEKNAPALLEVEDLGQLQGSLQAIEDKIKELRTRFRETDELDLDEYEEQLAGLQEQRADVKAALVTAESKVEMNEQTRQSAWLNSIEEFKRTTARADGVDYDKNPQYLAEWDRAVKFLASDDANKDKSGSWFLSEAHAMVKARFGLSIAKDNQRTVDPTTAAINDRRKAGGERVPHLAHMPQAGAEAVDQGEFGHLDKLSGLALERALAKMSPEQQERYLTETA